MKVTNKMFAFFMVGAVTITGIYNAVVINSASEISGAEIGFVKRLDEAFGVTVPGRQIAASSGWIKLQPSSTKKIRQVAQPLKSTASASSVTETMAAVQEELNLSLVEVTNPKKWQSGLAQNQFNGSLTTNGGVIESLSVSLPNNEGLSVSFSEMTGNVFQYDFNGELYSGIMYQVDQKAYLVTLTNGPLEGTKLRFSSNTPTEEQQQTQEILAEKNVEVGSFGNTTSTEQNSPETTLLQDQELQLEAIQAQSFNLENSKAI